MLVSHSSAPAPAVVKNIPFVTHKPTPFGQTAPFFAGQRVALPPSLITWHRLVRAVTMGLVTWLTASCTLPLSKVPPTPAPVGSCTLPLAATAGDEAAITMLISAEGEFVVKQDITALMQLWGEGAHIADAKNTPADQADDQFWLDKDAIRHRYVRTVFPGAPTSAQPKDLVITIDGSTDLITAVVTATTSIGNELSPAGDRWELRKANGCWLIQSLTYNLENP